MRDEEDDMKFQGAATKFPIVPMLKIEHRNGLIILRESTVPPSSELPTMMHCSGFHAKIFPNLTWRCWGPNLTTLLRSFGHF